MGFDLMVILNTPIDPETGYAYAFVNGEKVSFMSRNYNVPEWARQYLVQCGPWFHSYIKPFGTGCNQCSADIFLEYYPKWSDVKKTNGANDTWTKADHDGFKKALEWMVSAGVYGLMWSY
jgi:hypothetical protein